ncbi:GNAT family N-acetyltransferase [Bacillus sp. EB01]|uniref:GNAT family N-acetyltransferase n=1 Tax=Bacillus sp. EB01 TaxID=1347086 RepID=UPI0005C52383|nr:GNAT family N-acetyltransferase [Bacillus sp. EB01]
MITIKLVDKLEEEILHHLMQFYIYEFAFFKPEIKLEATGMYKHFNLKEYWSNSHKHPFFIKKDDELIGFALVSSEHDGNPNQVDEFHIIRKYTGRGYGKVAAHKLFEEFRGPWRITQIHENKPAQAFWRKVIGSYTNGKYKEFTNEKNKLIQEFHLE